MGLILGLHLLFFISRCRNFSLLQFLILVRVFHGRVRCWRSFWLIP
jgi:hypothetical protein